MPDNWTTWGDTADGASYGGLTLQNEYIRAVVTNAGASLVSLESPDRTGEWKNIVVTAQEREDYLTNPSFLGATAGRFANRIARGEFELDGSKYNLAINNGPNHLHGGEVSFAHKIWQLLSPSRESVTFRLVSPDGDEGYPGELTVELTYQLKGRELILNYSATTDAPTVLNLTNHTYWNLAGAGRIDDQLLQISADRVLENDSDVLPTGTILDVAGTPWDFRTPKPIGKDLAETDGGYDSCFLISGADGSLRTAAIASDPASGRTMEVLTTEPGIQLYTANHFDGTQASAGWEQHTSFCLESQHLPDTPNHPEFESEFGTTTLRPDETYRQTTVHRFGIS
ncbi:aldose epimerase family protein [Thalassoglobus sp. JC818]|uniref:aldose epimerase family protein n=1 Tax=Thalassoglobus sp. JC818 TaxID=3232136 RepID=UPI00345A026E